MKIKSFTALIRKASGQNMQQAVESLDIQFNSFACLNLGKLIFPPTDTFYPEKETLVRVIVYEEKPIGRDFIGT
jgi:hypothetical protein